MGREEGFLTAAARSDLPLGRRVRTPPPNMGPVTWLAALLTVLRFALSLLILLIPVWVVMEVIIWIALGFIPTGAATGRVRLVEAPSS